ncbi:MAG: transferase hexapeptide repeat containing protein [Acidobacteriaceae bacterium]|nr:transferase hexapeptide repeat containing protein [Acidobacteriaceae bacterium]
MAKIDLGTYDNAWYHPGRSAIWRSAWFFVGSIFIRAQWMPLSSVRVFILRAFGAHIGERVVVRPGAHIKYPWHLIVGNDCWLGERVWIDNLTTVRLGDSVCLSQGAYLCTGNHDWGDKAFGLMLAPIMLNDCSWAGAMSVLLPGTVLGEGSIAAAGSVISGVVPDYEIYSGNPGTFVKKRVIRNGVEEWVGVGPVGQKS